MSDVTQFGMVVIGDEILCGKRTDKHLPHVIDVLQARGMKVAWSRVVSDNRPRLVHELELSQLDAVPVLCFGGIGATPDDQTRQAAAEAFGSRLVRHPDAAAMIEEQFGEDAYPHRIRMADLPEDCLLIPNPHNRIPGFILYDHHFFPDFRPWPGLCWTGYWISIIRRSQRRKRRNRSGCFMRVSQTWFSLWLSYLPVLAVRSYSACRT